MADDYSFRAKVRFPPDQLLPFDEVEIVLADAQGEKVWLRSTADDQPLSEAEWVVLRGSGYSTEESARRAADEWRGVLERAFAATGFGADFGDRSLSGIHFAAAVQARVKEMTGRPLMADSHKTVTFPTEPAPIFAGASARGVVRRPKEPLLAALRAPVARVPVSDRERLAYTLFGASFFITESPESRFLLLMMAVEALIVQERRSKPVVEHVARLMECTRNSALSQTDIDAVINQLGLLKQESIRQAGRHLAASLADRYYDSKDPVMFFLECYDMRGQLVHSEVPAPARPAVAALIGPLARFVGDLVAGELRR